MSAPALDRSPAGFDVAAVRGDFPILKTTVHGKPLVYLDNAASAQKPRSVIDAESGVYERCYANVHRGVHQLSALATDAYEAARVKVQKFIGAGESREVIFLRGTTEAINLVAQTYGRRHLAPGEEILITGLEHHSNIVPWQLLCEETKGVLKVAPIDDRGEVDQGAFERALGPRTKIVAVAHVSNALGTVNPIRRMVEMAHERGAVVLVDGAQAVPHLSVDVSALDCDFYAFSGHKLYGPSGVGALYGKAALLEAMPPWQGGGDMIASVSFEKTTYNVIPYKFEAGTPNIAGIIALGAAIDYVNGLGLARIAAYEDELLAYGTRALEAVPGLRLVGTAREKVGVLSFVLDGVHPHDAGTVLDYEGIAVRTGHHCAQPVMDRYGLPATIRASLACFNTRDELDGLVRGLHKAREMFGATTELRELYQEVILDHAKRPRNFRALPEANHKAEGMNPLCGDRATVYLLLEDDKVKDVSFQGVGCSIFTASASMMTEALKGKSGDEAEALFQRFHEVVTADPTRAGRSAPEVGKLAVFAGVSEFPVRVKCASLPWHAFRAALKGQGQAKTE